MDKKVYLRVPVGKEGVEPNLVNWLVWAAHERPDMDMAVYHCSAGPSEARNQIVAAFLQTDCTHLWMVDADVVPPKSLAILDKDEAVLCGWYYMYMREVSPMPVPCVFVLKPKGWGVTPYRPKHWLDKEQFECDAAGTGCMLIDRKVLEMFVDSEPFIYGKREGRFIGEDITFCLRVQEKGMGRIRVLRDYECTHYREINLNVIAHDFRRAIRL